MSTSSFNQQTIKAAQPMLGGLPVRTNLRAGAWDDIDDQAKALFDKLTGALSGAVASVAPSTTTTTPAA